MENSMGRKSGWHVNLGEDDLEVLAAEVENLEDDELSLREAGFIFGYEEDQSREDDGGEEGLF